jgi:hypothetical protein
MGPLGIYQIYAINGESAGGMMTKMADTPVPMWLYYVCVDDIDAAVTRAKDAGGRQLLETHEVPGGMWISQFLDPQGAMFAMVGPTALTRTIVRPGRAPTLAPRPVTPALHPLAPAQVPNGRQRGFPFARFSAMRAFTIFLTSAAGSGLAGSKRMVPLLRL